jgi:hypothetical protein
MHQEADLYRNFRWKNQIRLSESIRAVRATQIIQQRSASAGLAPAGE